MRSECSSNYTPGACGWGISEAQNEPRPNSGLFLSKHLRETKHDDVEERPGLSPLTEAGLMKTQGLVQMNVIASPLLRAFASGNLIKTGSPKALTSHPLGLGVRDRFRNWWEEKAGVGEQARHGGVSPSRIHVPPFGKIISYSFRSVGGF